MTGNSDYQFTCTRCEETTTFRGRALTTAFTCKKCGVYFCVHERVEEQFLNSYKPTFAIGSTATFENEKFEVMGFVVKRETKYRYSWREYLLFSPRKGVRFLSEYDGNWNLLKPYPKHPWLHRSSLTLEIDGYDFQLYSKHKVEVLFASGEFFSNVIESTEDSIYYEHISPPALLTYEGGNVQLSGYLGHYITPEEVAKAFQVDKKILPPKEGRSYTQPLLFQFEPKTLLYLTGFAMILLTVLAIVFGEMASDARVLEAHFVEQEMNSQKMVVTPSFTLSGSTKNLVVQASAPVANDWFAAEYTLVNEVDQEEYVFSNEFEYYYGVDGGESWSEGSKYSEAFLSSIPSGRYHINIYPEFTASNHEFTITIFRDASFYSNYWVMMGLLCIFPLCIYGYRHFREVQRWQDSDYSPYRNDSD